MSFSFIADILAVPVRFIYSFIPNYGWTIIIFTVILKILTMPFSIKSQKSMARMQQVQPLISEIQRKYANNREKMQQELMRVYNKYEISPTGGCMPMLLQLVILMGFIDIVYRPYTYLLGISKASIAEAAVKAGLNENIFASNQLSIIDHPDVLKELGLTANSLDLNFFGINLSEVLQKDPGKLILWVLPVLAVLFTILSTVVSQRQATKRQNKNDPQAQQTAAMGKSMYIMMPIMTAWITYSWPLGCALYWVISTVTQMLQQIFIHEFIVKKMKPIELKKRKKKPVQKKVVKEEVIDVDVEEENE